MPLSESWPVRKRISLTFSASEIACGYIGSRRRKFVQVNKFRVADDADFIVNILDSSRSVSRRETLSVLARRNAQASNEGQAHLLFAAETATFGNCFDTVYCLLKPPTCCIQANGFYGFRRRSATRLHVNSREVARTHV